MKEIRIYHLKSSFDINCISASILLTFSGFASRLGKLCVCYSHVQFNAITLELVLLEKTFE